MFSLGPALEAFISFALDLGPRELPDLQRTLQDGSVFRLADQVRCGFLSKIVQSERWELRTLDLYTGSRAAADGGISPVSGLLSWSI